MNLKVFIFSDPLKSEKVILGGNFSVEIFTLTRLFILLNNHVNYDVQIGKIHSPIL